MTTAYLVGYHKRDDEIERLRGELDAAALEVSRLERLVWTPMDAYAEIERLRGLLADAPCTCENPPPYDWPHDPTNQECYLNRIREALGD